MSTTPPSTRSKGRWADLDRRLKEEETKSIQRWKNDPSGGNVPSADRTPIHRLVASSRSGTSSSLKRIRRSPVQRSMHAEDRGPSCLSLASDGFQPYDRPPPRSQRWILSSTTVSMRSVVDHIRSVRSVTKNPRMELEEWEVLLPHGFSYNISSCHLHVTWTGTRPQATRVGELERDRLGRREKEREEGSTPFVSPSPSFDRTGPQVARFHRDP